MTRYLLTILIISTCALSGCVNTTVVGKPEAGITAEEVAIYYIDRPRCEFETIAHIRVSGGFFTLDSMLKSMRRQAAKVGANGLYVLHTQQLDVKEYLGTAKAIRCLAV
jgi:hypothetical protein